jgi:opacity protein-like surface antigen
MKKLLVLVGAVALVGSTFAQKPDADEAHFSIEGGIDGLNWSAPALRMRYFLNDNIAVRFQAQLGDGIGIIPASEEFTYPEAGGSGIGTERITRSSYMIQLGAEYHLEGTERLSPYFALGLNFGGGSRVDTWTNYDGFGFDNDYAANVENGFSMFGVGLGAGMDCYIFENLYIGAEFGFNFMARTDKGQVATFTTGGTSTTTTGQDSKYTFMGTFPMNAAFRLGWRF